MARTKRQTNEEIVDAFRALLAKEFYVVDDKGNKVVDTAHDRALTTTKPWRTELWNAFKEVELRMCPMRELELTKYGTITRSKAND